MKNNFYIKIQNFQDIFFIINYLENNKLNFKLLEIENIPSIELININILFDVNFFKFISKFDILIKSNNIFNLELKNIIKYDELINDFTISLDDSGFIYRVFSKKIINRNTNEECDYREFYEKSLNSCSRFSYEKSYNLLRGLFRLGILTQKDITGLKINKYFSDLYNSTIKLKTDKDTLIDFFNKKDHSRLVTWENNNECGFFITPKKFITESYFLEIPIISKEKIVIESDYISPLYGNITDEKDVNITKITSISNSTSYLLELNKISNKYLILFKPKYFLYLIKKDLIENEKNLLDDYWEPLLLGNGIYRINTESNSDKIKKFLDNLLSYDEYKEDMEVEKLYLSIKELFFDEYSIIENPFTPSAYYIYKTILSKYYKQIQNTYLIKKFRLLETL